MQTNITLNAQHKQYVIPSFGGHSCFGFENVALHSMQMLMQIISQQGGYLLPTDSASAQFELMASHPLAWREEDWGQLSGYEKYQKVLALWIDSPVSAHTYYEPLTDPKVRDVLESARKSARNLRIFLGDRETGHDWMSENDVVGTVGRSMGPMKVPLLLSKRQSGGFAILTACIVRIIDADTFRELYRHPSYVSPRLTVMPEHYSPGGYKYRVDRDGQLQARFKTAASAHGYVSFMLGSTVRVNTTH